MKTYCVRPLRLDFINECAWPIITIWNKTERSISWSTVSNAADISKDIPRNVLWMFRPHMRLEVGSNNLVSLEWFFLYADWCSSHTLSLSKKRLSCTATTFSITFDEKCNFWLAFCYCLFDVTTPKYCNNYPMFESNGEDSIKERLIGNLRHLAKEKRQLQNSGWHILTMLRFWRLLIAAKHYL